MKNSDPSGTCMNEAYCSDGLVGWRSQDGLPRRGGEVWLAREGR